MYQNTQKLTLRNWHLRVRVPDGVGPHPVMFLLHGWLGNEDSMWVFAHKVPRHFLLIAPRGIYRATQGDGYGWAYKPDKGYSSLSQFKPSVHILLELIDTNPAGLEGDFSQIHWMGFSQGAATAFAFAALHPDRVASVAGLSGFVPGGLEAVLAGTPLRGKPIYVAHGRQDAIVPVQIAREGMNLLERAGATITYCESDVGHKLSVSCLRGMGAFYAGLDPSAAEKNESGSN